VLPVAGGTTGNVNVDRDVTIDSLEHVVALLERSARNRALRPSRSRISGRHLVIEPDDLRRHFFGHRAGDDHQIRLAARRPENFAPKPRDVVTRRAVAIISIAQQASPNWSGRSNFCVPSYRAPASTSPRRLAVAALGATLRRFVQSFFRFNDSTFQRFNVPLLRPI